MTAILSECGTYRYRLDRAWLGDGLGRVVWIMLNPSTADATQDDPTIRRCIGFSKRWGYDRLTVVNLFALRSTDPANLGKHLDPVGPRNDSEIMHATETAALVVAAWGANKMAVRRGDDLRMQLSGRLMCLGKTAAGYPRHPLYVPNAAELRPL